MYRVNPNIQVVILTGKLSFSEIPDIWCGEPTLYAVIIQYYVYTLQYYYVHEVGGRLSISSQHEV